MTTSVIPCPASHCIWYPRIGMPMISTMGLGRSSVNGRSRSPLPPARTIACLMRDSGASETRVGGDSIPVRRKPLPRAPHARLEVRPRLIPEQALGLLHGRPPPRDVVPGAPPDVRDARGVVGDAVDEGRERRDGDLTPGGEVHR